VLVPWEELIQQGDPTHAGDLMVVSFGELTVSAGSYTTTLFQDQLVGEVTFLRGGVPSASVTAGPDGAIVQIVRPSVIDSFLQDPLNAISFYKYLCYILGKRFRAVIEQNEQTAQVLKK
jgi:CRP-like cAMP-binding protein